MKTPQTFTEGGHMPFKNDAGEQLEVSPIDQENVAATLDDIQDRFISGFLHLDPQTDTSTLGSTGKRLDGETSSDIDIAIDYSRLQKEWDLPEWTGKRIEEWVDLAKEGAEKCGVEFSMAATVCSLRWPIVNDDGKQEDEYVQVDLMPTTNMKMTKFGRFSQQQRDGETFFKGSVRNIMLAIMARCAYHKDLTDDTHVKVLSDGTEKEVHNEYEGWTYDQNTGLHLCHKKYQQYTRNGNGFSKGDWKPHASVVDSPVISSDPDEIVEMIFGKGVTPDDVDSVQKMWRAWKSSPAVKQNPDLIDEVKTQVQRSAQNNSDLTFPDFDGEEFVNEDRKYSYRLPEKDDLKKPEKYDYAFKNKNDRYAGDDYLRSDTILSIICPNVWGKRDYGKENWFHPGDKDFENLDKNKSKIYAKVDDGSSSLKAVVDVKHYHELAVILILDDDKSKALTAEEFGYKFAHEEGKMVLYKRYVVLYMNPEDESVYAVNSLTTDGQGNVVIEMEWSDYTDYNPDAGLEKVNEAKAKKDPSEQVDDYIKSLSRDQIQTLTLRCSELLDKWNEPQGSDTVLRVRHVVDNDDRFLGFLRKTVPLTEPKPRDMGANTFVQKFFDPPFDVESFIGKMAREKGIPFVQAEKEWSRANLDKTHVGRYAHMLADDAVNGRPPSKEGENPKEIAVYTAIYDYARELVKGATNVESEVSLHADSAYVGGKFDLLMKKKGVWTLVDWKTNDENLDDIPTGKVGIDELTKDINNNSYNKYALQLNVYEWAAKDSGKIPRTAKVSKELHHFRYLEEGKPVKITVVKVPDLQELVQAMVERAIELGVVKRK